MRQCFNIVIGLLFPLNPAGFGAVLGRLEAPLQQLGGLPLTLDGVGAGHCVGLGHVEGPIATSPPALSYAEWWLPK